MYSDKMAVAIKANGRVLREQDENVFLPFGAEYEIQLKNLNSVRAIVKIWIDGTDVTEGTAGLIVPPNDSVHLERFIKDGNLSGGNKFKFIERTAKISAHRGNKIDDGLVRVEFEFERKPQPPIYGQPRGGFLGNISKGGGDTWNASYNSNSLSSSTMDSYAGDSMKKSAPRSLTRSAASASVNQTGITAAGAVSSQQFSVGAWFPTDGVKHVMVLNLLGEVEGEPVIEPFTVQHDQVCSMCGTTNAPSAKFCTECSTSLNLVKKTPLPYNAVRG